LNATPPSASPPESARSLAARVVTRVVDEGAFSSITLRYQLSASTLEGRDRGFATELVYGTVTWLTPIDRPSRPG
jgi:16S rRNA (cytosine967-C5)-methyltransferase